MKKICSTLIVIMGIAVSICASAQSMGPKLSRKAVKNAPRFEFVGGDKYDFGPISDARPVDYVFQFKNVGKKPLIIFAAEPSCGCTTPQFSREPIAPGASGQIKVTFNPAGRSGGPFDKAIYIKSNAPSNVASGFYEIHIVGTIMLDSGSKLLTD